MSDGGDIAAIHLFAVFHQIDLFVRDAPACFPGVEDEKLRIHRLHGSITSDGDLSNGAADVFGAATQVASRKNAAKKGCEDAKRGEFRPEYLGCHTEVVSSYDPAEVLTGCRRRCLPWTKTKLKRNVFLLLTTPARE